MSYIEYPLTYTSVFGNFRESDQMEMETNAMMLAQDDNGPLPYEIEVFITPGDLHDMFHIKRASNFMIRVMVFSNESQKAIYLEKRDLRYNYKSDISSNSKTDENNKDQV